MIRSDGRFINNGDGYVIVHCRSRKLDLNGNSHHCWVAFDYDTGAPIAVSDCAGELEGDELQFTAYYSIREIRRLTDRLEFP